MPNGHWRGQVSHDSHRLSKVFPTQQECFVWVRKNRNQISEGLSYASSQLTLGEHLDGWLTNKKVTRRYATWLHYDWLTRRYICPTIGNIKLKDLQAIHIQNLYSQLLKSGTGVYSIRKIHFVLPCSLNQAVKQELILRNPASLIDHRTGK